MAAELLITPSRAADGNNNPYSGATWTFYASGTSTPQAVYADADLSTSLGSTVTADSGGKFQAVYFNAALAYRGVCKNASGSVTLHDFDPINNTILAGISETLGQDSGANLVGFSHDESYTAGTVGAHLANEVYVTDKPWLGDVRQCAIDCRTLFPGGCTIKVPPRSTPYSLTTGPVILDDYQTLHIMKGATLKNGANAFDNMIVNRAWAERATNAIDVPVANLVWLQGSGALFRRKALVAGIASFGLVAGDFLAIDDEYQAEGKGTGSITADVLTVTAVDEGTFANGQTITTDQGVRTINGAQLTGTPGGIGTYPVSAGADVSSRPFVAQLPNENSPYRGVFQVIEVSGADRIIKLVEEPTANPLSTGIYKARKPNRGITLINEGVIDYNKTQNDPNLHPDHTRHAVLFCWVEGLRQVDHGLYVDTSKFCACWGANTNCRQEGKLRGFNLFSDGLKVYGPSFYAQIDTVEGFSGDDLLSIHNGEPLAFEAYHVTRGAIIGLHARCLHLTYGAVGGAFNLHVYPQGPHTMDCEIDEITGDTDGTAVAIWDYDGGHQVQRVKIGKMDVKAQAPLQLSSSDQQGDYAFMTTEVLGLEVGFGPNVRAISGGFMVEYQTGVTVDTWDFDIQDIIEPVPSIGQGVLLRVALGADYRIGNLKGTCKTTTTTLISFAATTSIMSHMSIDGEFQCVGPFFDASGCTFTATPTIDVEGIIASSSLGTAGMFQIKSNAKLSFEGATRLTPNGGFVLLCSGGEIDLAASDGTFLTTGQWLNTSGGGLVNPKSFSITAPVEDTAKVKRKAGNRATTISIAGTIPANTPCICDNTGAAGSWNALVNGAVVKF